MCTYVAHIGPRKKTTRSYILRIISDGGIWTIPRGIPRLSLWGLRVVRVLVCNAFSSFLVMVATTTEQVKI